MTPENLKPLNDRILIKVLDEVEEYNGELHLPDISTTKEKSDIGLIVATPKGYIKANLDLQVGDRVMFNRHSGNIITFDKFNKNADEYRLIKESDLLGKIIDS